MSGALWVSPRRFAELEFEPGSAPCDRTIRRWVKRKLLPSRIIGDRIFINLTAFRESGLSLFEKIARDVSCSA